MANPRFSAAGRWVLAASILGSSMAFIDGSVVSVALPVLQEEFGAPASSAQWIVEAYQLFVASLVLVGGSLADRYGRKKIFVIGTSAFAGASLACGLAPNTLALIAARSVQGIAAALLIPSSLALLGGAFTPGQRGRAVGTWAALTGIAAAIGPALGGWLVQAVSWRAVFLVNLPIAAAVLAIALRKVPESRSPSGGPLDLAGAALATFGFGAIVYGLIEAPALGWANPLAWGTIAAGLASVAALTLVELRVGHPMVPLGLFRNRTFAAANLLTFFLYAALAAIFFFIPFVLIQARRYTPAQAGAAILPLVFIVAALSRPAGAVADRVGPRLPLTVGPLVAGAGFLLLGLLPASGSYVATMLPALSVLGLGMAITVAPLTATVLNGVPGKDQGTASGISNAVARVAGLLAIAIFGILAVSSFERTLDPLLDAARISHDTRAQLAPERAKLGAMKPPEGLPPAEANAVRTAVRKSLDGAFRVVSLGCAVLALLSAACAAIGVAGPARSRRRGPAS